ncbi:MAG: hypothetical protein KAY39_01115 [Burkholderiaceae bacterium]|nr:hypothetical protein [Burkholderiaceae bacterium]
MDWQALALSVPVQLDSATATADSSLCAQADVYYADTRQDPARVQVQQAPAEPVGTHTVQITSAAAIDEPMVTVYLQIGCGQKVSRRFVMLADYPNVPETSDSLARVADAVATSTPVDTPALVVANTSAASTVSPTSPADATTATRTDRSNTPSAPDAATPATRKAPRARPDPQGTPSARGGKPPKPVTHKPAVHKPAAAETTPAKAQRARLKLDPLENLSERIKTLEATTTVIPLEDMVRDAQRIAQLQDDVKKLLEQTAKNEATLAQMRTRMEQAETDRVSSALVYALAALVLACLAAIAVLWNRRPVVHHGWANSQQDDDDAPAPAARPTAAASTTATLATALPTIPAAVGITPPKQDDPGVDLVEMEVDNDSYDKLIHPPADGSSAPKSADSAPSPLLATTASVLELDSESQFDLRQQAAYFDSLGKTDEAIEMLEKRIRANSKDCPLIYLELLRIANVRSLKTDFRQFRDECMQAFNVAVPEFALFRSEGRALDAYPDLLAHIEKLWNSPKALEVLESCILRDPWEKNAQPFDLAAFKELVMLHGLAGRAEPMPTMAKAPTEPRANNTGDAPGSLEIDLEL